MVRKRIEANWRSQYHLRNLIKYDQEHLNTAILNVCPSLKSWILDPPIWVSPLVQDNYEEYQDRDFLIKLNCLEAYPKLKQFWPNGGPVWNGLAILSGKDNAKGVILLEGKSYVGEVINASYSCQASTTSRKKVGSSLNQVKFTLGVDEKVDWLGDVYQHANRIAHLYFLKMCSENTYLVDISILFRR